MRKKVINFSLLFLILFSLSSCISNKLKFGTITEISDSIDSAKSLEKISSLKKLDFSAFEAGRFSNDKISLNYRFLKPQKKNRKEKFPLILVFHGSGAIGNDNQSQMGILSKMWLLPENLEKYPAYILAPQFPKRSSNYHLDPARNVQVSQSDENLDLLLKSLDSLIKNEDIDANRIYVLGFSMGGATTSNAISTRPDLFAAAINISGISQFDHNDKLLNLPIWIVHGSLDTDNFPQSNERYFEEMKSKGKIFLWKYKDKYHNNILSSELIEEIPKWLFKQKK